MKSCKCEICGEHAEVKIGWNTFCGWKEHKVCDACGHNVWNAMSTKYNGTEAFNTFTIEPIGELQ